MEFFSKHVTNSPQTNPPRTTTQESLVKAMISMAQITQATNSRIVRGLDNKLMANPKYVKDVR